MGTEFQFQTWTVPNHTWLNHNHVQACSKKSKYLKGTLIPCQHHIYSLWSALACTHILRTGTNGLHALSTSATWSYITQPSQFIQQYCASIKAFKVHWTSLSYISKGGWYAISTLSIKGIAHSIRNIYKLNIVRGKQTCMWMLVSQMTSDFRVKIN